VKVSVTSILRESRCRGKFCRRDDESSETRRTLCRRRRWNLSAGARCRRNVWDDDRVVSVSYSEPAVLWRLRDAAGNQARATIIPGNPQSTLVIFVNDRFERGENFEDWSDALARANEVRSSLMESGWSPE